MVKEIGTREKRKGTREMEQGIFLPEGQRTAFGETGDRGGTKENGGW